MSTHHHQGEPHPDNLQVRECLAGNAQALSDLRARHESGLKAMLLARGASGEDADKLLADFWKDCVAGEHPSWLEKYNGKASFKAWLGTVLTNRLSSLKRTRKIHPPRRN